jgi:O-antigen/teichoic acid export membrane protein
VIIIVILAELFGPWYINNHMVLPPERQVAANWCFQFSLFNFCMKLITIPYDASIVAHERMKAFAYVGLIQGLGTLAISYLVYLEAFDRLVFYAMMLTILQFCIRIAYQIYCRKNFEECTYSFKFDKPLFKNMLSYSSWQFIGNGAVILKKQGVNVILNYFFGPIVNAARGISNQVDAAVEQFAHNFMVAMNPQITKSYACGDTKNMVSLVFWGARLSYFMVFILSLPIIINAKYILGIWLKNVPDYAVIFTQLTLIARLSVSLSRPLVMAQNATGDVKKYQLTVGIIQLLHFPMSFVVLYLGCQPESFLFVTFVGNIVVLLFSMYVLSSTIPDFDFVFFLKDVCMRCLLVTVLSAVLPFWVEQYTPYVFWGFLLNIFVCIFSSLFFIIMFGCKASEREIMLRKVICLIKRKK